ncbi:MAG TPA: DUF4148 domain-containing protein [Paraburkholderia sp.]
MKKLIPAVVVAAVLAVPAVSAFAQAAQPLTRAQVRAELVELEKAGYNPAQNDISYPENLQAAQKRVEQEKLAQGDNTSGYGAPTAGTTAAGAPAARPAQVRPQDDIYGH